MITAKQCAAGRRVLQLSEDELSQASGVSVGAIIDFESGKRPLKVISQQALRHAFEAGGVVLLQDDARRNTAGDGYRGITKDPRDEGLGDELE
jgi:transcriptional regulator with XRE-family HTH domain